MTSEPLRAPEGHAVLIGISNYGDPEFPPIPAAANSLNGMLALLTDPQLCGWRPDQVTVIRDARDSARLAQQLRRVARATSGPLLIYYVGHGTAISTGELCLILADTDGEDADLTGLEYTKVKRILLESPASVKVVILDCCYSGRAIEALGSAEADQLARLSDVRGVYTLTAADSLAHVVSPDLQATSPTSFTGQLLALVRAGLPGGPEQLTLADLYPHLRQQLAAQELPRPNQSGTDTADRFIFTRNAATQTEGPDTATRTPTGSVLSAPRRERPSRLGPHQTRRRRSILMIIGTLLALAAIFTATLALTPPRHTAANHTGGEADRSATPAQQGLINAPSLYPTPNCATPTNSSSSETPASSASSTTSATGVVLLPPPADSWRLNNASAGPVTTVTDVGALLHGVGGVSWHTGDRFSPDALFDGRTGELSACSAVLFPWRDFTISFWAKPTGKGGMLVAQDAHDSASFMVYEDGSTGRWIFAMAKSDTATWNFDYYPGPFAKLNAWTQMTVTYDYSSEEMRLYVNGAIQVIGHHAPLGVPLGDFNIGADYLAGDALGEHFAGQIADVRVWTTWLPPDLVGTLATSNSP